MKLAYQAVDRAGQKTADTIEATDRKEANEKLRQRGLFVTSLSETTEAPAERATPARGSLKLLALWSRQLCVLVRSGTPLAQAMLAIERQTSRGPWQDALGRLRQAVEEGSSLSDAMALQPKLFDQVSRSLVAAGESSGQLGPMLDRLAALVRRQLKIHQTLVGAMVYPALLVVIGIAVTLVMLLGVVPRFAELFDQLDVALPPTTQLLLTLGGILQGWWWLVIGGLVVLVIGCHIGVASPTGRSILHRLMVHLPYIGRVTRSLATARIARLMGVMLDSRVPLLQALSLTKSSVSNLLYVDLLERATNSATQGEPISRVLSSTPLIDPSVAEAIRHGEQNGQLGPILLDMAEFLDEENEVIVRTAMKLVEPIILILLGIMVGFIALSLFIPLFDLTSSAGAA